LCERCRRVLEVCTSILDWRDRVAGHRSDAKEETQSTCEPNCNGSDSVPGVTCSTPQKRGGRAQHLSVTGDGLVQRAVPTLSLCH
jgi:hypothetical protein